MGVRQHVTSLLLSFFLPLHWLCFPAFTTLYRSLLHVTPHRIRRNLFHRGNLQRRLGSAAGKRQSGPGRRAATKRGRKTTSERAFVRRTVQKSTHFLRRLIAPVQGQGGVTLSCVCPHRHRFPIEDYILRVSTWHASVLLAVRGVRRPVQSE